MRLLPAWGGRVVVHDGREIPLTLEHARAAPGSVAVGGVQTVEHLLAALSGLGLTDVRVEVDGPELPALDGSAQPWCALLADAGREEGPPTAPWRVDRVTRVEAHGGWAELRPGPGCRVEVRVDFPGGPAGQAVVDLSEPTAFCREVAWARTFVLGRDVDALRDAGRGRGADLGNTVVLDGSVPRNPGGLRAPDEPVRHKLLDAVGDLALVGPVEGHLVVVRGSHRLHVELLRRARALA